jgi:transcriptional regulator with XRE-family HTH domain
MTTDKVLTDTTLRQELRRLREERGLSQAALAQRAGVDTSYISRLERGAHTTPRASTLIRIANALDLGQEQEAQLLTLANLGARPLVESPSAVGRPRRTIATQHAPGRTAPWNHLAQHAAIYRPDIVIDDHGQLSAIEVKQQARIEDLEQRLATLMVEIHSLSRQTASQRERFRISTKSSWPSPNSSRGCVPSNRWRCT